MSLEDELRILVVEDAEAIRKNISSGLRLLGYVNVTCVSNGQAALEFLQTNRIDLVLSDWYMEPVNGLELLKSIRSDFMGVNHSAVFVMLTGETAKEKVMEAVKEGVDGYIIKPFTLNALGVKIHEALKRRDKL